MSKIYITQKFIENVSASRIQLRGHCLFHPNNSPPNIRVMYLKYTSLIVLVFVLVNASSFGRCEYPYEHRIKHMVLRNQPCRMVYNIHDENDLIQSGPRICMCKVDNLNIAVVLVYKSYLNLYFILKLF